VAAARQTHADANDGYFGRAVVVFGTLAILYFARGILVPLAFALILAFLLTPVVTLLGRIRISRVPAVIITVLIAVATVGLAGYLIVTQLVDVANQLPQYRENIHRKIDALEMPQSGPFAQAARSLKGIGDELARTPIPVTTPQPVSSRPLPVRVVEPEVSPLTSFWNFAKPSLAPLAQTTIVVIFTIFILIEKEDLRNRLLRLAGTGQLNMMTEAMDEAATRVSRYLSLQVTVNACFGLILGIGLYFIGVPFYALWGVVAGMLRIVPYVGTVTAGLLPLALSLAVFDGWSHPLMVFGLFAFVELLTANFVEPTLYGSHTGISSLAILVAAVFWTALWGPSGLILSTPLTVCLVVLGRNIPQLDFLHVLLGDEEVLSPAAQLYQRLLAMDQDDARDVVDAFMKNGTLATLYDEVLVPALTMAEQDRHRATLDATREEFLFLNINELVAEFSETAAPATDRLPFKGRILCIPAHDQADEIAAAMLAQLLEHRGCIALSFPAGAEAEEMMQVVEPTADDLICISALQPYAFAPARSVCRRLRSRFKGAKICVGIWGFSGDRRKATARFERSAPDCLFVSFQQVIEYMRDSTTAQPQPTSLIAAEGTAPRT
jgi:predicted PurR-regulated permease PerM